MASNEINTQEEKDEIVATPSGKIKSNNNNNEKSSSEPKLVKPIAVNLHQKTINFNDLQNSQTNSPKAIQFNNGTIPIIYYPLGQMKLKQDQEQFNPYRSLYVNPQINKPYEDALTPITSINNQSSFYLPKLSNSSINMNVLPTPTNLRSNFSSQLPPNLSLIHNVSNNMNNVTQITKPCCSCTKTKCIKKYCECFSKGKYCIDCHCVDCMNKGGNNSDSYRFTNELIICTCTKSNCCKKYCDCFKAGYKCNEKCRCLNCMNKSSKEKGEKLSPIAFKSRKESKNHSTKESSSTNCDDFCIQRISVLINNEGASIKFSNIEKEDTSLLGRKRSRSEEGN